MIMYVTFFKDFDIRDQCHVISYLWFTSDINFLAENINDFKDVCKVLQSINTWDSESHQENKVHLCKYNYHCQTPQTDE